MTEKPLRRKERWKQDLIQSYYDYRYRRLLEPLYEQFQRWKAGQLEHFDLAQALQQAQKENQELYGLFSGKRARLVEMIERDRDWFEPWLAEHPAPPGIHLADRAAAEEKD